MSDATFWLVAVIVVSNCAPGRPPNIPMTVLLIACCTSGGAVCAKFCTSSGAVMLTSWS